MSISVAWRWEEKYCLASDSCISIDAEGDQPKHCGIKVLQVPVRVISATDASTGHFTTLYTNTFGLSFVGRFITAYLVKENISELLFNLQYIGQPNEITFEKICKIVFACYTRVLTELGNLDADFFMVGHCPKANCSKAAKFYRDPQNNLKWGLILEKRPFDYEVIGPGEEGFKVAYDIQRQSTKSVHFAALEALDQFIKQGGIPSIGGAIQYGEIDAGTEFHLSGIIDYSLEAGEFRVHKLCRGVELDDLYKSKEVLDLHVHYEFLNPFEKKKRKLIKEMEIYWAAH
jgi:hypothetical protein